MERGFGRLRQPIHTVPELVEGTVEYGLLAVGNY